MIAKTFPSFNPQPEAQVLPPHACAFGCGLNKCVSTSRRRGMSILESLVALSVLTAAVVAVVQFVGVAGRQRRANWQRLAAQLEVANQAERLMLQGWDQTAAETLSAWSPSTQLQAAIPDARCQIKVQDEVAAPISRRLSLRVTWNNAAGQEVEPVELAIWKFPAEANP